MADDDRTVPSDWDYRDAFPAGKNIVESGHEPARPGRDDRIKPNDIGMAGTLVDTIIANEARDPRDPDDAAAFEEAMGLAVPAPVNLEAAIQEYAKQRTFVDRLKADLATEQERLAGNQEHLFSMMEQQGLRSVKHELGSFRLDDLADPVLTDPAAFIAWAQQHSPELLIANRMRLGKLIRDNMKGDYEFDGTDGNLPPGADFRTRRNIAWSGRKKPDGAA